MSYTYGYLKEAVLAHIDLDEQEVQAMNLQNRYHIFANEAMQAICGVKPKYDYFRCEIVAEYWPLINLGDNQFRKATEEEINSPDSNFADEKDTQLWYEGQNIFLINSSIRLPNDFIAFAEKQAWAFIRNIQFQPELFIRGYNPSPQPEFKKIRATKEHFMYGGRNTLLFYKEGHYAIPYKSIWHRFISGIGDDVEIDMPTDIFFTIPLYIAALCLQIDHAQKAMMKRAEFETALARCTNTDFLELKEISPTFR